MFDHSAAQPVHTPTDVHSEITADASHAPQTDSVASVIKTLWHQAGLMNGASAPAATAAAPVLTVAQRALTVNAGGSIALPITVSPTDAQHAASVTISGLTNYESVTDHLDGKVFTGSSITLTAAEVNSGVSLASAYTGTGHPVNTLTMTASDSVGHHDVTSAAQSIVVTDPPVSSSPASSPATTSLASTDTVAAGQNVDVAHLFSIGQGSSPITQYQVYLADASTGGHPAGSLTQNGTAVASQQNVTLSTLDGLSYTGSVDSGTDALWVRAFDGTHWSSWSPVEMTNPGTPSPVTSSAMALDSVAPNHAVSLSQLFSVSDSSGAPVSHYQVYLADAATGGHPTGSLSQNSTAVATQQNVTLSTLDGLTYTGSVNGGTDALWVRAFDGTHWSNWSPVEMSDSGSPPPVTSSPVGVESVAPNHSVALSQLYSVSDPSGSPISHYQVYLADSATGGQPVGSLSQHGTAVAAEQNVTLSTLTGLTYTGSAGSGTDALWVRAFDGTHWSNWSPVAMDNVGSPPPVVHNTMSTDVVGPGHTVALSQLYAVSDPSGAPISHYQVYLADSATGGHSAGSLSQNGTSVAAQHNVTLSSLNGLTYSGSSTSGTDALWVRASDGTQWSNWSLVQVVDATAPLSTDGSILVPGNSSSLVTAEGTWTFSSATGAGGNAILLNGSQAANGTAQMLALEQGHTYADNTAGQWYEWANGGWTQAGNPLPPTPTSGGSGTGAGASDPAPAANAFYVSPNGSDSNSGTLGSPFATLAHAQQAMEGSSIKTTYVEGGTYHLSSSLNLTSADSGETWRYYPPSGVDSAVLDGGSSIDIFDISGASNVTIDGLTLQHFYSYGINGANTPNLTVENCNVGFNVVTSWQSAGIVTGGNSPDVHFLNNYVHDVGSQGIALFDGYNNPGNIDGSVISGNVVLRAVQRMYDGGSIYVSMHGGNETSHVTVENNYVADMGSSAISGPYGDSVNGIYLDDNASNVTVTGNVIAPPAQGYQNSGNNNGDTGIMVHNGHDNHIYGNIIDLGNSGELSTVVWGLDGGTIAGMAGNTFTGNIVMSSYAGTLHNSTSGVAGNAYYEDNAPSSDFTIQNNVYYDYAGGQVNSSGPIASDSHPIFENPEVSGWNYAIAGGSPVRSGSVNFAPIAGGWGPAGFVVPQNGAPPSSTV